MITVTCKNIALTERVKKSDINSGEELRLLMIM